MKSSELLAVWAGSFAYTGYVAALAFLAPMLLGDVAGVITAIVLGIGPVVAASFWMVRS